MKGYINFNFIDILVLIFGKSVHDRFYFVSKVYMHSIDLLFLCNNFCKWNHKYKCVLKILGSTKFALKPFKKFPIILAIVHFAVIKTATLTESRKLS